MTERDPDTDNRSIGKPWTIVSEGNNEECTDSLHRIKVEGGYLYRSTVTTRFGLTQSMCFVPEIKNEI